MLSPHSISPLLPPLPAFLTTKDERRHLSHPSSSTVKPSGITGRSRTAERRTSSHWTVELPRPYEFACNARRISSFVAHTFRIDEFIRRQTASRAYRGNWLPRFPIFFRPERMNPARLYALCVALLCLLSFTVARELHQNAIHRGASPHEHGTLVGNVMVTSPAAHRLQIRIKARSARGARPPPRTSLAVYHTTIPPYHHHRDLQEETPMRKSGRCCRR